MSAENSTDPPAHPFLPAGLRVFPNVWPGDPLPVQPGDVTQFVPMGCLFNAPVVVRPWDTLESAMGARNYYGAQPHQFHPFQGAPLTEPSGGIFYFDAGVDAKLTTPAFRLAGAATWINDYAVFVSESTEPQRDGFLMHCRIIPFGALGHLFRVSLADIPGSNTPQPMNLGTFLRGFIDGQEKRWGTSMNPALYGCMGGDGDWAKESLCFGFMMENSYYKICRIWSRAWLVTK